MAFKNRTLKLASLGMLGGASLALASLGQLQQGEIEDAVVVPPPIVQPAPSGGGGNLGFYPEPTFDTVPQTWKIAAHVRFAFRGSGNAQWIPVLQTDSKLAFLNTLVFTRSDTQFVTEVENTPNLLINLENNTRTSFVIASEVEANLLLQLNATADKAFTTDEAIAAETSLGLAASAEKVYAPASIKTSNELTITFAGSGASSFIPSSGIATFTIEGGLLDNATVEPISEPIAEFAHTSTGSIYLVENTTTDFVRGAVPEAGTWEATPEISVHFAGVGTPSFIAEESPSTHSRYTHIYLELADNGSSEFIQAALPLAQQKKYNREAFLLAMVQAIVEADEDDQYYYGDDV